LSNYRRFSRSTYGFGMDSDRIIEALTRDRTVDITTTGAKSGTPQRIEIWTWIADGRVYLTGSPGRRDWYANLKANPELVVHVKSGEPADLPAQARPIEDPAERREVFDRLLASSRYDREEWLGRSPLAELDFTTLDW
jgi:deazaflavin-dependent oxidoreductase (nitroreductase family)